MTATNVTNKGFRAVVSGCFNPKATWTATGLKLLTGTVVPNYLVLTIIYAPPGTNGGHSTSSVSYQAGSTAGTTTSSSQSFKTGLTISVEASGGILGTGGGAGVSFGSSQSNTDSQSVDIKKSTTSTLTQVGPSQDGINHDEDEIWLLLKPTVNLALSGAIAEWMLASTHNPVQYVHVGWLNGHEAMPAGVASALSSAGITPEIYPDLLARDPLAAGSSPAASDRFVPINTTFPYEPPYSQNDPVPTYTYNISSSTISTQAKESVDGVTVQAYVSGSADFLSLATVKLKDTVSWEWSNKSSTSTSAGTSQSAQLTIGGPSYGYSGPTVVNAYFDTVYRTFAFDLVPADGGNVALRGTLLNASGTAAAHRQVTLTGNGQEHLTVTNAKGEFEFYGDISGKAIVRAPGVNQTIPHLERTRSITLHPNKTANKAEVAR